MITVMIKSEYKRLGEYTILRKGYMRITPAQSLHPIEDRARCQHRTIGNKNLGGISAILHIAVGVVLAWEVGVVETGGGWGKVVGVEVGW